MPQRIRWQGIVISLIVSGAAYGVGCSRDAEDCAIVLECEPGGSMGGTSGGGIGGAGACHGCDDMNPCTKDSCSDTTDCTHEPDSAMVGQMCADGSLCDSNGKCVSTCVEDSDCDKKPDVIEYCFDGTCYACDDGKNGDEDEDDCGATSKCGYCNGHTCDAAAPACAGKFFCVDGYCCNEKCDNLCYGCDGAGAAAGTCTSLPLGTPDNACPNADSQVCDGNGACKTAALGSCTSDDECLSAKCKCGKQWPYDCGDNDMGTCKIPLGKACTEAIQCILGKCENGTCAKLGPGAPCTSGDECKSTNCAPSGNCT